MRTAHAVLWLIAVALILSAPALAAPYGGGSGTPEDPYQIWTAEQLSDMASHPETWSNWESFILMADIDLDGYDFSPIGSRDLPYKASFDGNQHSISNMTIDRPNSEYIGLIGHAWGASISNISMLNVFIRGQGYVGVLIGQDIVSQLFNCLVTGSVIGSEQYAGGLIGSGFESSFDNCSFSGSVSGKNGVGGLCGGTGSVWITNCQVSGIFEGQNDLGRNGVGGVVGCGRCASVFNSNFRGTITGKCCLGGIIGGFDDSNIQNCISNCTISGDAYLGGIVGQSSGTISNCHVFGKITAGGGVGGIVGANDGGSITKCISNADIIGDGWIQIGGICGVNIGATISDCSSSGSVTGLGEASYVGGLVGNNSGIMKNSYATGNVSGKVRVGGLVGSDPISAGNNPIESIINCYATGTVTGEEYVGGLIGRTESNTITSCYATGSVSGKACVGGMAGWNSGNIISCFATGSAEGIDSIGGLTGYNLGSIRDCYAKGSVIGTGHYIGGLVGWNDWGSIATCYSIGSVQDNATVGGLVGYNYSGTVSTCFWDTQTSGQPASDGGTGLSTAQMKMLSIFTAAGWDFVGETANGTEDIWTMPINGYPVLSWQKLATIVSPNGGESYAVSSTQNLIWNVNQIGDQILLQYSIDYGGSWIDIATVGNTGSYSWIIPSTLSNTCLVKITSVEDPSIFDTSDGVFSIVRPGVYFADANLKAAVEAKLSVTNPTEDDMLKLTYLDARTRGIVSLVGLETAVNLTTLYLLQNAISDLTPLAGLNKLAYLNLYSNKIADLTPLSGLTNLTMLAVSANQLTEIGPLAGLPNLVYLYINNNQISDFSPITNQTKFKEIYANRNAILTKETYLTQIPAIRANNPNLRVFQYDPGCQTALLGDLTQDCRVNLADLAAMAENWLKCNHIYPEMCL